MLFSSLTFLFYFLPAVLVIHQILPQKGQNLFLFLASLLFYGWGEPRYVPLMLLLLAANYALSRFLSPKDGKRRKALMALGAAMNIGVLGFYKYSAFFCETVGLSAYAPHVTLPLGISFFTFQTLGYLADVYRGQEAPERSFIDFGCFIMLFPQLIAGPILRYGDLKKALHARRRPEAKALERGMALFLLGLAAKVLLANPLGEIWEELHLAPGMGLAWMALIGFALQIYFDFFGYSLMAMGIGGMLGFPIARNFDRPYTAVSLTDFWRRWHITLQRWFRDYVYIPLGGSRRGTARTALNLLIVWLLTGLWHGASWNFVLWGLYDFLLLAMEKFLLKGLIKRHRVISRVGTLFFVLLGWAVFAMDDLTALPAFFGRLFSFSQGGEVFFWLRQYGVTLALSVLCVLPPVLDKSKALLQKHTVLRTVCLLLLLVLSLSRLIHSSYNPFLYFRF